MIDTRVTSAETPKELSPQMLAAIPLFPTDSNQSIDFASPQLGLAFIHDRRWRVTLHRRDLLVLRMVENGEFLAQCNITPAGSASEEPAVESARFRAQVEQTLSTQGGHVEELSQATTDAGVEMVRIAAAGGAGEVPITWYYYLLTRKSGERYAVVFTLASKQQERFGSGDLDLIGRFEFPAQPSAAQRDSAVTPR
jgi:hypothetical protein